MEDSILGPGENLEIPPLLSAGANAGLNAGTSLIGTLGTVKDMSKIFPTKGNPTMLPKKIVFHGVSFSQKRWCCAIGAKLDKYLARIVLIATPTPK